MPSLQLALPHGSLGALVQLPILSRIAASEPADTVWLDTAANALGAQGMALSEHSGSWHLERMHPGEAFWPAMALPPVLADGGNPDACGVEEPSKLGTSAGFRGRRHFYAAADESSGLAATVEVTVLEGELHGVAPPPPVCFVRLDGRGSDVRGLALHLASVLPVSIPRASLAAEALAAARGQSPAPRHLGAPVLHPDMPLTDSIATVMGQLTDVMLHWSTAAAIGATPVPVHQMRVATRRLRSALSIFKHVAACPEMEPLSPGLRETATKLGAARDWDVFLGGIGAQVQDGFPGDRSVAALFSAIRRKRLEAYAALRAHLSSTAFRELQVALGCMAALRPWEAREDWVSYQGTAPFASAVLARRLKTVRRAGRGLGDLPIEALHELRKDCKRLRYASEFFEPLFPHKAARRFLARLSVLQEELGMLNDGAVASGLMAHLGRPGRSYAAGLVIGLATSGMTDRRALIATSWKRFKQQEAFWE